MFRNYKVIKNLNISDNELFKIYIKDVLGGTIPDEYKATQNRIIIENKNLNSVLFIKLPKLIQLLLLAIIIF